VRLTGGDHDQLGDERDEFLAHRGHLGREGLAVGAGLEVQHGPAVRVLRGVREERPQPVPELAVGGQAGGHPGAYRLGEGLASRRMHAVKRSSFEFRYRYTNGLDTPASSAISSIDAAM
jgi:hypothetical protein